MKKIISITLILSLCFISILFFITAILSTDLCNICPPPDVCTIVCNETNSSLQKSTQDYFKLILPERSDILVEMQPALSTDYNLIMIKDKETCPSQTMWDCFPNFGLGSPEQCGPWNLPAGTYYILVENVSGPADYDINITCGNYCGIDGCFNFNMWVEPKNTMLTVGKKTWINLYIQNTGKSGYSDEYNITYKVDNPALIWVDMSTIMDTKTAEGQIKKFWVGITILSRTASGEITFNATSVNDPRIYRIATLTIYQSEFPISLPEFDLLHMFEIFILAGIIYSFFKSNH